MTDTPADQAGDERADELAARAIATAARDAMTGHSPATVQRALALLAASLYTTARDMQLDQGQTREVAAYRANGLIALPWRDTIRSLTEADGLRIHVNMPKTRR